MNCTHYSAFGLGSVAPPLRSVLASGYMGEEEADRSTSRFSKIFKAMTIGII